MSVAEQAGLSLTLLQNLETGFFWPYEVYILTAWAVSILSQFEVFSINDVIHHYGKYSKMSDTFLFLISNKMFVIRTGIHKMLVRKANREDSDQTAS